MIDDFTRESLAWITSCGSCSEKTPDVSRAARRWTTAAEESCTTGTMRKD